MNGGSRMEAFFLERGRMDVYEKMQYEKIDEESIKDMTEDDLKEFLPKYGDRIALRSFIAKRRKHKGNAKMSLLEKLKHKLKRNETEEEAGSSLSTLSEGSTASYSKNALKNQRIIEFGLMVFEVSSHLYKSIRAKKGGGVRKTKVSKHNCKADLLQAAKEIFLNDQFGYGSPDEFECDIMDYKQVSLEDNITVGEIIDSTKLQKLRFYLALKRKTDIASDSDDSLPDIRRSPKRTRDGSVVEKDQIVKHDSPIRQLPVSQSDVNEQTFCTSTPDNTHRSNLLQTSSDQLNLVDVFPLFYQDPEVSFGPTDRPNNVDETLNLQHDIDLLLEEDSAEHVSTLQNQENVTTPVRPEAAIEERTIHIRRGNCMADLMGAFSEDKALQQVITIVRTLETGEKELGSGNGVVMDCLCEFWSDFYERCTTGLDEKVPFLRHDFTEQEWKACARIYLFGWAHFKYIPVQLSTQFIKAVLGRPCQNLVGSFLKFANQEDSQVIRSALEDFASVDLDDLLDVLGNHSVKKRVNADTLQTIIREVAHKELIQEPMFIIDNWKEVLQFSAFGLISDADLSSPYEESIPTGRKVLKRLTINTKDKNEEDVGNHLKRYLRETDSATLGSFLRFCTGSDLLLDSNKIITVEFTDMPEVSRTPIGRTCSQTIQLANRFDNFPQFRAEMNSVLRSNIWVFDIV